MERREFIKGSGAAAAAATFGGACASVTGSADRLAYLGGTPVMAPGTKAEAVNAELAGVPAGRGVGAGANFPLHWSSVFDSEDLLGKGIHPSRRFLPAGVTPKSLTGTLPVADTINEKIFGDPWFKRCDKDTIDIFVEAIHKVAKNVDLLRGLKPKADGYSYWNRNRGV